eukprot:TRINITY_DN37561_c0_g1_i1.p1 TRINITY_DN37561_c0_g1~~TRINITY_DN37561_c0_g1_i1.p1  ORF type:complete len:737 (+),score=135.11 TRINITY_DN37561_c0_g1_i1:95-2305(+)
MRGWAALKQRAVCSARGVTIVRRIAIADAARFGCRRRLSGRAATKASATKPSGIDDWAESEGQHLLDAVRRLAVADAETEADVGVGGEEDIYGGMGEHGGRGGAHPIESGSSTRQARISPPPEAAWVALEKRAVNVCATLRSDELMRLLHAFLIAQRRPKLLLARVAEELPERLPQLDVGALCVCLHVYGQLRAREARLFTAVTRRALHADNREKLRPVHLASLLYSFSRVLLSDPHLMRVARRRLLDEADRFSPDDMATTLQALVTARKCDDEMAASCAEVAAKQVRAVGSSLQSLCDTLSSLARLGAPCSDLQRELAERGTRSESADDLARLPAESLVKLLYGLGEEDDFSSAPPVIHEMRRLVVDALGVRVDELDTPRLLTLALEAIARAYIRDDQLSPSAMWHGATPVKLLGERITASIAEFSLKNVVLTATACQRLMVRDAALFEGIVRQGIRKGQSVFHYKTHYGEAIFEACRAVRFRHPVVDDLLQALEHASERRKQRHEARAATVDGGSSKMGGGGFESASLGARNLRGGGDGGTATIGGFGGSNIDGLGGFGGRGADPLGEGPLFDDNEEDVPEGLAGFPAGKFSPEKSQGISSGSSSRSDIDGRANSSDRVSEKGRACGRRSTRAAVKPSKITPEEHLDEALAAVDAAAEHSSRWRQARAPSASRGGSGHGGGRGGGDMGGGNHGYDRGDRILDNVSKQIIKSAGYQPTRSLDGRKLPPRSTHRRQ